MKKSTLLLPILLGLAATSSPSWAQAPKWPAITQQNKPWTRWWWEGSAVNQKDLTSLLEQYNKAGLGGVEITAIYGVHGAESQFIDFLSPKWMGMLTHTLKEAGRLDMGVDMAQASGWPFGGPWVTPTDACKYVAYQTYSVKGGEQLKDAVTFMQKPIIRAVNHQVDIKTLVDPVAKNKDLQTLALDQVRFEKPLPLQTLMAYSDKGETLDLTVKVDANGKLNWTAPAGSWTLYGVFQGWHGKQVERAGPGGEGDVVDHLSKDATQHYLQRFDEAFKGYDIKPLRAFFNDSYEVDDAQGEANWTPAMFTEFQKRHGYDLRKYLPALFGKDTEDKNRRVLCDYRETISELLLENYTKVWSDWAKTQGAIIRNQAHGSPANILDLYAVTDIPETEGTDLLRIKFASSAANVTGKKLASSESATWENEHFLSKLSDVKVSMDRYLLGGVNHTFYHGTNYSPASAPWPGWLFYAAVHFNPNNSFWTDFGKLNTYVAHCQSFLQQGKPNNDVLVYLPMYDSFSNPSGKVLLQHYDGIDHGFKGMPVEGTTEDMLKKGYGFDFISDKQLQRVTGAGRDLHTGGVTYQTILLPDARLVPLATLQRVFDLAQNGATIVVQNQLPTDIPGLTNLDTRRATFKKLLAQLKFTDGGKGVQQASLGKGKILVGKDVDDLLAAAGVKRETMVDQGIQYVRRSHDKGHYYFMVNRGEKAVEGWVKLQTPAKSVALYNPMSEKLGMAALRNAGNTPEVYVQLAPGESCILETNTAAVTGPVYAYLKTAGSAQPINGTWDINFVKGGPELPAKVQTKDLGSWTNLSGDAVKKFSGTATYTTSFPMPTGSDEGWVLDLGKVAESARVQINGQDVGTLIGPVYQVFIPKNQLKATNTLTVSVSNAMANRIADMDKNHVEWKKFYNVNVAARLPQNRDANGVFTAEKWAPRESGLLGPVTLTPATSGAQVQ